MVAAGERAREADVPVVLLVDDEESFHIVVEPRMSGFDLLHAYNAYGALDILGSREVDVVLLDLNLPGPSGFAVLERLRQRRCRSKVLVLTAHYEPDVCIAAIKLGARDVLYKCVETITRLADTVLAAAGPSRLTVPSLPDQETAFRARAVALLEQTRSRGVRSLVERARSTPRPGLVVLATEPGIETEPWARLFHAAAAGDDEDYFSIDAASAPPEDLLARSGAPLWERPSTFLLDRAGDLPRVAVLELLERARTRPGVAVLVAAPLPLAGPLDAAIRAGQASCLTLPPLRARREDVPALLELAIARAAFELRRPLPILTERARSLLAIYPWPGNDEEMANEARRLVALYGGEEVDVERLLPLHSAAAFGPPPTPDEDPGEPVDHRTRRHFRAWLARTSLDLAGSIRAAARLLGVSTRTIRNRLREEEDEDGP